MSIGQEISGNDNEVITVGGNFNLGDTFHYYNENSTFYKLNLDEYNNTNDFTLTPNTAPLLTKIELNHVVIIAGAANQKVELLKHCAAKLINKHGKMEVLEWSKSAEPQTIFDKLDKHQNKHILLLPNIAPSDLDYNIKGLIKASRQNHFILISTEKSQQEWNIPSQFKDIWQNIDEKILYHPQQLIEYAQIQYQTSNFSYPLFDETEHATESFTQLANSLKTPDKVDQLLHLMANSSEHKRRNKSLDWFIDLVIHDDEMVTHWFRNLLTIKEQMLAIGLSFFDGLIDDQCLSGIDLLVQDSWRKRDTSLQFIDYGDLNNLFNFFHLHHTSNEIYRLSSTTKNLRLTILQAAWKTHKRLVLASIPTLIALVRNSVQKRVVNNELYGSIHRRDRLRQVLSETISDIGLISIKAGDEILLQLAADDNTAVQKVAARALASWHNHPRVDLYDKLINWLTNERIAKVIVNIFEERNIDKRQSPLTYVKNLITHTLGFVSRNYSQNHLPDKLLHIIDVFISDQSRLAVKSLCQNTLRILMPLHLSQLQSRIIDINRNQHIYQYLPTCLSLAYRTYPDEIKEILEQWHFGSNASSNNDKITKRERELACTALTYAKLPLCTETQNQFSDLTPAWAFEQIKLILAKNTHFFIREHCLQAITTLVASHFKAAEFEFQQLITKLTIDERSQIIKQLGKIYLKQRQSLAGAEDYVQFEQQKYPIWIEGMRPKTEIEKSMFHWITTSNDPIILQFTYQCESYFKQCLDIYETSLIAELEQQRHIALLEASMRKTKQPVEQDVNFSVAKVHSLIERFGLFLLTLFNKRDVSIIVKSLIPIVITQDKEVRKLMFDTYQTDGRSHIVKALKRVLKYARKVGSIVMFVILMFFII